MTCNREVQATVSVSFPPDSRRHCIWTRRSRFLSIGRSTAVYGLSLARCVTFHATLALARNVGVRVTATESSRELYYHETHRRGLCIPFSAHLVSDCGELNRGAKALMRPVTRLIDPSSDGDCSRTVNDTAGNLNVPPHGALNARSNYCLTTLSPCSNYSVL